MTDEELHTEIRHPSFQRPGSSGVVRVEITADADREEDFQKLREAVAEVLDE